MYKSPIEIVEKQMRMEFDDCIWKTIQDYAVSVDKDELLKALHYDRDQYDKGYQDGYRAGRETIVHCYDCKYCKVIRDTSVGAATWHCKRAYGMPDVDPEDYCSKGERREQNA